MRVDVMEKEIVKSKVKCPRCGNKSNLKLHEIWRGHTITWEVKEGNFDRNDGSLEHGDAYKVASQCTCGHFWTVRKALQIDDIILLTPPAASKN